MPNDISKFEEAAATSVAGAEGAGGRSFPSGWWILPALAVGILLWTLALITAAGAVLDLWWN